MVNVGDQVSIPLPLSDVLGFIKWAKKIT
jgi:hypothetical protein